MGYIGENNASPIIMDGLKRMEYRGYDSSGVVVLNDKVTCVKSVGKLEKLEKKLKKDIHGNIGIGHSRWATHGGVTEENAHPQHDCKEEIFVAHNGIIENYKELKEKLIEQGHKFISDTDTEVISHLIEHFFESNLEEAVKKSLSLIKGTYGLVVVSKKDPQKIVVARMFSPIAISVNKSGGFVSSDPVAIIPHSKKMVFLEDGDVAVIKKNKLSITNLENEPKYREETEMDWNIEEAQKGGYPHFMLKEIMEQSDSVANSMRGRLTEDAVKLGGLESVEKQLQKVKRVNIVSCGTSYYAGLAGKYLFEDISGVPCEVELASEFSYGKKQIKKDEVYLFLSQSGETADTLAALRKVKNEGGLSLGVVNVVGSSIARETDAGVYNHIGPEISVASTKAFTSQVTLLNLLALFFGRQRELSQKQGKKIVKSLSDLPEKINKILELSSEIERIAKKYKDFSDFLFIGRRYSFPVALEGSLKLKEISYIHAEGYAAGEMKHGPLALIDKSFPTVALCPSDSVYSKMISNIGEIKSRGGRVIALATEGDKQIEDIVDDVIYLPKVEENIIPITFAIPMQLLAYHIAVMLGTDLDMPRNLSKSVTVE